MKRYSDGKKKGKERANTKGIDMITKTYIEKTEHRQQRGKERIENGCDGKKKRKRRKRTTQQQFSSGKTG